MQRILFIAVLIGLSCFPTLIEAETNRAALSAGTAWTDITPPLGCPLWGYGNRKEGADGVLDPLLAKILVLQSTQVSIAFVSWDVCEFQSPRLRDRMRELSIDRLLLLNSHTHYGPDLFRDDFPSKEKPWKTEIENRIYEAIRKAKENMFPAYIAAGEGSIQLGYNRLRRDPDGLATTIFQNTPHIPYGPVDPNVGVIRVTDETGAIRAVFVRYACHPVTLGSRCLKISTDYVGPMYRKVEKELGSSVQCLFVQGGAGDINPLYQALGKHEEEDLALPTVMGELLAGEVLGVIKRMDNVPGRSDELLAVSEVLEFKHRWEKDKTLRLGTTSILINGEIGIVTLPGEPFHQFQIDVREKAALPHAFMFGYCDDSYQDWPTWYLPDIQSAARGGYGASDSTIVEVGTGERLVNQGLIQLYTLRGMLHPEPEPGRRP